MNNNESGSQTPQELLNLAHQFLPETEEFGSGEPVGEDQEEHAEEQARQAMIFLAERVGEDPEFDSLNTAREKYNFQNEEDKSKIQEYLDMYVLAMYFMVDKSKRNWDAVQKLILSNLKSPNKVDEQEYWQNAVVKTVAAIKAHTNQT